MLRAQQSANFWSFAHPLRGGAAKRKALCPPRASIAAERRAADGFAKSHDRCWSAAKRIASTSS